MERGVLCVYDLELEVNEERLAKVSNMLIEGRKFYREGKKCMNEVVESFFLS